MDGEWAALQEDAAAAAGCRRWASAHPVLAGCGTPAHVVARARAAPDVVLGHLLAEAGAGDRLAGRVVLQALLPKVVRMAAVDRAADVDDYLASLWCEIAAYPLARRPTSVAANLALDTLKAVHAERRPAADVTTPPDLVELAADRRPSRTLGGGPGRTGPHLGGVLDRARQHHLVDAPTSELLRSVYGDGLPGAAAAARHGISPAAVRLRCSRAVRTLARHADLLAGPA